MLIIHKGHTDTIHVYSVTVMTHVKALEAGHSSQGTSEPITPVHNTINIMSTLHIMYNIKKKLHDRPYITTQQQHSMYHFIAIVTHWMTYRSVLDY